MGTTPDSSSSPRDRSPAARPLWRRVLGAPEAGLVLVILLLGAALTAFGGTRPSKDTWDITLPTSATARVQSGEIVVRSDDPALAATIAARLPEREGGNLRIEQGGQTRAFDAGQRPRLVEAEGAPAVLKVRVPVNKFLNIENLTLVANSASYIAIMAVGMTMIIAMGGIDLSVGMIWALAAYIGAFVLKYPWNQGLPPLGLGGSSAAFWLAAVLGVGGLCVGLAGRARSLGHTPIARVSLPMLAVGGLGSLAALAGVVLALRTVAFENPTLDPLPMPWYVSIPLGVGVCAAVGAICGLVNGSLTVGLRVHPFIITLGMMAVLEGAIFVLSRGQSLAGVPDSYGSHFFKKEIAGVTPVPVFVMVGIASLGVLLLTRSVLGRRTLAIGDNEKAATYAGIPVGRVKITVFTLMGALAGLSAAVNLGYWQGASPGSGQGYELQVIAATVIGGASLAGGRGSALGAVLGALLIQLITNGMIILDIDQSYNKIVMGTAIVVAVVVDQAKRQLQPKK